MNTKLKINQEIKKTKVYILHRHNVNCIEREPTDWIKINYLAIVYKATYGTVVFVSIDIYNAQHIN
ncbi:hypothetical protein YC2023_008633 [Brassica napus]